MVREELTSKNTEQTLSPVQVEQRTAKNRPTKLSNSENSHKICFKNHSESDSSESIGKHSHQRHHHFLGSIDDARTQHEWLVYNEHIHSGYRINYHSWNILFRSIWQCHNETTNIWSHLLGVVAFVAFMVYIVSKYSSSLSLDSQTSLPLSSSFFETKTSEIMRSRCELLNSAQMCVYLDRNGFLQDMYSEYRKTDGIYTGVESTPQSRLFVSYFKHYDKISHIAQNHICSDSLGLLEELKKFVVENLGTGKSVELEKWPMVIFLGCAISCFMASSTMHLLWVRSLRVCNLTHNIDLSGISLMIFGSAFGMLHYVFKCENLYYWFYVTLQFLACAGILICINFKFFNTEKYQNLKVVLFVLQALISAVALIHWYSMEYVSPNKQVAILCCQLLSTHTLHSRRSGVLYCRNVLFRFQVPRVFIPWKNRSTGSSS